MVSFPNIACDVELLALGDDEVVALAPPGMDPHEYQLTPDDIELLKGADIIVSTAHTPFEMEIRELHDRGEISGILVEIPRIPGIRIMENPATGQPNYHMPIYDPGNYKVFITYLASLMAKLRPGKQDSYLSKAEAIVGTIDSLLDRAPRLDLAAVADLPFTQYAVSWLGIDIRFLLVKEHGVPATPGDLLRIEEAISSGKVCLAVVCEPATPSASRQLRELATEHGLPILYVPSPLSPRGTLEKLEQVAERASGLHPPAPGSPGAWDAKVGLALASTLLVLVALTVILSREVR